MPLFWPPISFSNIPRAALSILIWSQCVKTPRLGLTLLLSSTCTLHFVLRLFWWCDTDIGTRGTKSRSKVKSTCEGGGTRDERPYGYATLVYHWPKQYKGIKGHFGAPFLAASSHCHIQAIKLWDWDPPYELGSISFDWSHLCSKDICVYVFFH